MDDGDRIYAEFEPRKDTRAALVSLVAACEKCGYFCVSEDSAGEAKLHMWPTQGRPEYRFPCYKWPDFEIEIPRHSFLEFCLKANPPIDVDSDGFDDSNDNWIRCSVANGEDGSGVAKITVQLGCVPLTHRLFVEPAPTMFGRAVMLCHELALRFDTDRVRFVRIKNDADWAWENQTGQEVPESALLLYAVPPKKT